ncbi:MAG: hypothetical protein ACK5JN_16515 [Kluyvera sp.]|uniref:hypothetical protein n=1 Tax=Kluyvera sp. TaxID=1538228 RepID=UPI003A8B2AD7
MGTKRYEPYTGQDAAVVYTQLNEQHQGLIYFQRFAKEGDCYKDQELIYISNNLMEGKVNRFYESRIRPNTHWSLYVMNNSSGHQITTQTAFIPEAGKHYVAIPYQGVVEVPQDLKLSGSDNLDKIYEQYKDKPAQTWNVRNGVCKFWFAKMMGA